MDYDGANVKYLTDSSSIVLAPRFSPNGDRILFTSYASGFPAIYVMNVGNLKTRNLGEVPGTMTFAPRFSPDGNTVVFSLGKGRQYRHLFDGYQLGCDEPVDQCAVD